MSSAETQGGSINHSEKWRMEWNLVDDEWSLPTRALVLVPSLRLSVAYLSRAAFSFLK